MKKPIVYSLLFLSFLFPGFFLGCQQSAQVSTSTLPPGVSAASDNTYLDVDCLLPGQVRKLGSMVYAAPRRPMKTTAGDCEIRGGEYVLYDRANYKESLAVWMVEAEGGDPLAQTYVGEIYMKSPAEKPRYDLAATWFEKAAEKGHKRAQVNLAYLYENGLGVALDVNKAAVWYSRASGSRLEDIVQQQQQISAQERAELRELKTQNSAQIAELQSMKKQMEASESTLVSVRQELDKRNRAIKTQQQEIISRHEEMKKITQQLSASKVSVAADLEKKLRELEFGLKEKEQQLSEQKRLAADLSGQIKKQQNDEQQFKNTLAGLNEKIAGLPGPKIEVFDPQLLRTRGVVVAAVDKGQDKRAITGQVWSPAGLRYLKINDRQTEFKDDGKFRADFPLAEGELKVRIVATDNNGKSDAMDFTLQPKDTRGKDDRESAVDTAQQQGPPIAFGKYYALVIGNNDYKKLPKLQTAVEDAKVIGKLLEDKYGFKVTFLFNADRNAILSTLNDFRKKLTEKDNFLLYYAGHGTLEEKNSQGFWLPVDSEVDDDVNWLPTDRITGIMNLMSAKQIMIIADACYSGIMTRAGLTQLESGQSEENYNKWLVKMAAYKSRVLISSGENKPVLDGGGGKHSVFAKAFLDTLGGNSKILLGIDLHRAIAEKVVDISSRIGHDQVPQYAGLNRAGHELGDFLFVPKQQGS